MLSLFGQRAAQAEDEALAPYRERFRQGMERYRAGALAEAVALWAPIYEEIGGTRGYRLAYNLGVAYEQSGDATRAAEHYQSFLSECTNRAARGETEDPIVVREQAEAKEHLEKLIASKARIHVPPTSPPVAIQIDQSAPRVAGFVAFVAPGTHTVRTSPGTESESVRSVDVQRGEVLEIVPDVPRPHDAALPDDTDVPPVKQKRFVPVRTASPAVRTHPFSATVLYVFGGASIATTALPLGLYLRASQLRSDYGTPKGGETAAQASAASQFAVVRPLAYASFAIPASLAVTTIALSAVYLSGGAENVNVSVVPERGGASGVVRVSF